MITQKGGSGGTTTGGRVAGSGVMRKRTVEIPSNNNGGKEDEGEVLKLVKATTPKGLREVKNVLRWRVPNENSITTEVKSMNYGSVDRPRSAPSASISDPPEKIQRVNSFNKVKAASQKAKVNNVHKRHWMYLYDNLHRAVDEMYKTCEQDFSVEQCINVVHTMELCMEDFKRLVHKIRVQSSATEEANKNRSIAWDEPYPRSAPSSHAPSPATPVTPNPPRTPVLFFPLPLPVPPEMMELENLEEKGEKGEDDDECKYPLFDLPSLSIDQPSLDLRSEEESEGKEEEKESREEEGESEERGGEQLGGPDLASLGCSSELPWAERLKRSLSRTITPASAYKPNTELYRRERHRKIPPRKVSPDRSKPAKIIKHSEDARIRQDEKQAKASKNREIFVNSKKEKVALTLSRVKNANERQNKKRAMRQMSIEEKQEKAVIIHEAHIDQIKRKATAENTKVDEVAYITAQITETRKFIHQKRLEDTEARRQGQLEGKKKKLYVQAAKEEAVVERKKQIEHAKMHMQMQNDVLGGATTTTTPHNRKSPSKSPNKSPHKVGSKTDLDLQARRLKRVCKYCNVELLSDEYITTHLSGRKHKQAKQKATTPRGSNASSNFDDDGDLSLDDPIADGDGCENECVLTIPLEPNLPYLAISPPAKIEAIAEAERVQKKKAKKTKLLIEKLGSSYQDQAVQPPRESPHKSRLVRSVTDLRNLLAKKSFSTMSGVLSDISRVLGSKGGHMEIDLQIFRQLGGIDLLVSICGNPESKISYNVFSECISLLSLACTQASNRLYMIMTGKLVPLLDLLNKKILVTPEAAFLPALETLLTLHFWQPAENGDEIKQQTINYIIQICLFEKIEQKLAQLQTNIDGDPSACLFIEQTVEFLESITAFLQSNTRDKPIYVESTIESQIIQVLKKTSIVGILSLLASLLLQGRPTRGSSMPPTLPATTWSVIFSSVKVLNNIAALGFQFLQSYLGDDDHQVELFHLLGHLLWYCSASAEDSSSQKRQKLLNEIILLAGYYALQNSRTQETFQWGNSPTILQLLCALPFQYFSDPRYKTILFPTLISVCFQNTRNTTILQQEMSVELIVDYIRAEIESKDAPYQVPARFLFKNRFPTTRWTETLEFFSPKSPS